MRFLRCSRSSSSSSIYGLLFAWDFLLSFGSARQSFSRSAAVAVADHEALAHSSFLQLPKGLVRSQRSVKREERLCAQCVMSFDSIFVLFPLLSVCKVTGYHYLEETNELETTDVTTPTVSFISFQSLLHG